VHSGQSLLGSVCSGRPKYAQRLCLAMWELTSSARPELDLGTVDAFVEHAEQLAEMGDFDAALRLLQTAQAQAGTPSERSRAQMELGAMTARSGALAQALVMLQDAERSAQEAGQTVLALEAKLHHCSVLGAMGHMVRVLPALREVVGLLGTVAGGTELLEHAQAELASFQTFVATSGEG
jgi:hypothetical protein